jgi:hypothetical protein
MIRETSDIRCRYTRLAKMHALSGASELTLPWTMGWLFGFAAISF